MNRNLIPLVAALALLLPATIPAAAQSRRGSFDEFRKGILNDYASFRKTILDHYADFLEGEWHEYQSLNALRRDPTPKPPEAPHAGDKTAPRSAVKPAEPLPEPAPQPEPQPEPDTETPSTFNFFGMTLEAPELPFTIEQKLYTTADYAAQWRQLERQHAASRSLPAIKRLASDLGLNGYLTYRLIDALVGGTFAEADPGSRLSLVHYLLAQMGYDVRIAMTADGAQPVLMIPFDTMVYGRAFMVIDGERYYLFGTDADNPDTPGPTRISTCRLPETASSGRKADLRLGNLNLPFRAHDFSIGTGTVRLSGTLNANLIPLLYRYPQMPVGDYALSAPQKGLREELASQLREQLGTLEPDRRTAELLTFMHTAFDYATDDENHGFEKPYFIEETLYYPRNDCEDRAIFYAYFLWNALERPAGIVGFPGHEAVVVKLDTPVKGTSYNISGEQFYISDPTFIGAPTGMVMPAYRNETPRIDACFPTR